MAAHALDDPVWGSLTGIHSGLALRSGRARAPERVTISGLGR